MLNQFAWNEKYTKWMTFNHSLPVHSVYINAIHKGSLLNRRVLVILHNITKFEKKKRKQHNSLQSYEDNFMRTY